VIKGGKLKRHIFIKHKTEPDVAAISSKPPQMQKVFFEKVRREGIHQFNMGLMADNKEPSMRERRPDVEDKMRLCDNCKGYFSNVYFSKHKCSGEHPVPIKPKLLLSNKINKVRQDKEFCGLLNRFQDDVIGNICRTNETIIMIGYRHFNLRRHEEGKHDECRKVVMRDMRTLARLYDEYLSINNGSSSFEDMLTRQNLDNLVQAVENLVSTDDMNE
jgi:hypothetical protein